MKPVCQLDNDYSDILRHSKEHFSKIFCLHLQPVRCLIALISGKMQMLQLGNTIHKKGNIRSELLLDLLRGQNRILHHIMQQSRCNGFFIHFQICKDDGHAQGVDNIGLSGFSYLILMCFKCSMISLLDQRNVIGRVIFPDTKN